MSFFLFIFALYSMAMGESLIEDPNLADWQIRNSIKNRQKIGIQIDEVWVKTVSRMRLLYK